MITPVVGAIRKVPLFIPDPFEVSRILNASISELIKEDAVATTEILAAGQYRLKAPHFQVEGEIVWGATAMMLNEFRLILREIL